MIMIIIMMQRMHDYGHDAVRPVDYVCLCLCLCLYLWTVCVVLCCVVLYFVSVFTVQYKTRIMCYNSNKLLLLMERTLRMADIRFDSILLLML